MDLFKDQKRQWVGEARAVAHKLLKNHYSVTIEDVLALHPRPHFLHRNIIGTVFNQDLFERVGYKPSRKATSHGRIISVWTERHPEGLPVNWDEIMGAVESA